MKKIKLVHSYNYIISIENLLAAWKEFIKGKKHREDVREFEFNLMGNIISLHNDLAVKIYKHGGYQAFNICDPKPRNIHKASVRDRLVHRAVYRILYPFFERIFIPDSFSCRINKGTHKAIKRFKDFYYIVSKNNTKICWVLKCDIKKFFASIDHKILKSILAKYIPDKNILWLLSEIINSFYSTMPGVGLPLGNLTSQLLVNIYMNEFDQFVKHKLKAKYYIRYADDFLFISENRDWLKTLTLKISDFLDNELKLKLHPSKVYIKTLSSGLDFLGWIHFSNHWILRTATRKRMLKRIILHPSNETINSYLGLIKHGNTYKIKKEIFRQYI